MGESSAAIEIPQRTPILDKESAPMFPGDAVDRQWRLLTEAVRRDLVSRPEIRKTLIPFCTEPVSESLPRQFVSSLSGYDERIAKLAKRFKKPLSGFLDLPSVPDDQIQPDIRHAKELETPKDNKELLAQMYGKDTPLYREKLQNDIDSGSFLHGITGEERRMIAKRYAYARDVKILALGAEMAETPVSSDQNGDIVLPSGVKIGMNTMEKAEKEDLLHPQAWEKRKQIKDRVYEISVGGRRYILKEKKTSRHTDTLSKGHRDGVSSSEEFAIAQHLQDTGTIQSGLIRVDWERPIGFVTYPDGFQFSIFSYEEGLIIGAGVTMPLASAIVAHKEQFEDEHKRIINEKSLQLSFEDFAMVKAVRMRKQAKALMDQMILQCGYTVGDLDGYAYRISSGKELNLAIVGFDFEYFKKIPKEKAMNILQEYKRFNKERESRSLRSGTWSNGELVSDAQRAAYMELCKTEE